MAKVTVIFVGGDELLDKVIEGVTHGTCSHVAIQILGGVLESQGVPDKGDRYPGVHLRALDKYDNNKYAQFIEVEVPDLAAAERKAKRLLGKVYSYIGCVEGGAYDLFGIQMHPWITKFVNYLIVKLFRLPVNLDTGEWTMNCSETVTRILRAGGLSILSGVDADCITPEDLLIALNGIEPSKINNIREIDTMSEELKTVEGTAEETEVVGTVATAAESVIDQEKDELIAKLKAEIASTKSKWVKFRDTMYIAALEEADDLVLEALVNKLAKL